jgi:hypothetical protein
MCIIGLLVLISLSSGWIENRVKSLRNQQRLPLSLRRGKAPWHTEPHRAPHLLLWSQTPKEAGAVRWISQQTPRGVKLALQLGRWASDSHVKYNLCPADTMPVTICFKLTRVDRSWFLFLLHLRIPDLEPKTLGSVSVSPSKVSHRGSWASQYLPALYQILAVLPTVQAS